MLSQLHNRANEATVTTPTSSTPFVRTLRTRNNYVTINNQLNYIYLVLVASLLPSPSLTSSVSTQSVVLCVVEEELVSVLSLGSSKGS